MCYNTRCTPVDEVIPVSAYNKCPNNCSGNGVCNSINVPMINLLQKDEEFEDIETMVSLCW